MPPEERDFVFFFLKYTLNIYPKNFGKENILWCLYGGWVWIKSYLKKKKSKEKGNKPPKGIYESNLSATLLFFFNLKC